MRRAQNEESARYFWINVVNMIECGGPYNTLSAAVKGAGKVYSDWSPDMFTNFLVFTHAVNQHEVVKAVRGATVVKVKRVCR